MRSLSGSDLAGLPAGVTNQTGATFGFTSSSTALTCALDGAAATACTSPTSLTALADGAHSYTVTADQGLSTEVQLTYQWTVDTVAPGAPTVVGPTGTVSSDQADITVTPAAVGDAVTCEVDLEPASCAAPFTLTGLSEGPHAVVAVATDAAGNTAEAYAYWVVDTTAPTPTVTVPTGLTGPAVVEFDEDVTGLSADSVAVTDETGTPLAATLACRDYLDVATACDGAGIQQVRLTPSARLVPGEHYAVVVNPPAAPTVSDVAGNAAAPATQTFRGAPEVVESSPALGWTWRTVKTSKAKGGSYLTENRKGAAVSWTFSGRSVSWLTVVGPTQGIATVLIDGVKKATVNNYAQTTKYGVARSFKGLAKGKHTITVKSTGKKGARAAKGTFVAVDGFKVGTRLTATPAVTAAWQPTANAAARDGGYAVAGQTGQSASLTFRGTGVTWVTATGKAFGKAAVYVDGVLAGTYDNYSETTSWQVERSVTGLTDATHTLLVKVLGTKNAASSGTLVVVDGFTVS